MAELDAVDLLDYNRTIARELFYGITRPWEVIPKIADFVMHLGESLPKDKFNEVYDGVWVAKSAQISKTAEINGPSIIDEGAEIRHGAYIRGNAIIGRGTVVGNSTEIKNSVLFDEVQVPHYNYIGDSVLGYRAHFGAGSITSNVKSDKSLIEISCDDGQRIATGLRKFGAIVGDGAEIGCNAVLNPGTIVGRGSSVYPLVSVRGCIDANCICKAVGVVVPKR